MLKIPAQEFLAQAGTVLLYSEPQGPGIRVDGWIEQGSVIPVHYDPLLAKLIVWADTRDAARRRAVAALRNYAGARHPHEHPVPYPTAGAPGLRERVDRHGLPRSRSTGTREGQPDRSAGRGPGGTGAAQNPWNPCEPRPWNSWNLWKPSNHRSVSVVERFPCLSWMIVKDGERQARVAIASDPRGDLGVPSGPRVEDRHCRQRGDARAARVAASHR